MGFLDFLFDDSADAMDREAKRMERDAGRADRYAQQWTGADEDLSKFGKARAAELRRDAAANRQRAERVRRERERAAKSGWDIFG